MATKRAGQSSDQYVRTIVLLGAALLCLTFVRPIGFDNALYQTMAIDLHRYGRIPYLGTWDQNFPGIIYIHYIIVLLFGVSDLSVRCFDCVVELAFAIFFYRFWLRWLKPHTAALAAILYLAYYVSAGGLLLSERDVYGGMLIVLSVHLLFRVEERPNARMRYFLLSAFVAGLTLLLRPTALLPITGLAASILLTSELRIKWKKLTLVIVFVLLSMIPLSIVLLAYATMPHGLKEFYLATIRWNLDLYGPINNGWQLLAMQFVRRALLTPLIIYGLLQWRSLTALMANVPDQKTQTLIGGLALSNFVIALIMRKYFDYHFAPFYILTIPIAALVIEHVAHRFTKPTAQHAAMGTLVLLSTFIVYNPRDLFAFTRGLFTNQSPFQAAYEAQYPNPYWSAVPEGEAIEYLNSPRNHDGLVETCSFTTNFRLHLHREAAGKFVQLLALAYRKNPDDAEHPIYTDYQCQWQREFVTALSIKQPRFIVLSRMTSFAYFDDVYNDCLRFIPGFDSLLRTSYRFDTSFGGYQIYRNVADSSIRNTRPSK